MQIAPGVDSSNWWQLDLDHRNVKDWAKAVAIFHQRIIGRYIEPMDFLIVKEQSMRPSLRRFGFTVLAIDCLLVETLQSFFDGLEDTKDKSERIVKRFLTTHPKFKNSFTNEIAKKFYEEFRCGILHQAEIGGKSKVWSTGDFVVHNSEGLRINRNEFHSRLKEAIKDYESRLLDPKNSRLRRNFRKKMNYICRN